MNSDAIIRTVGLTKRYGDFTALSDCSVTVRRGEVFGLLGPNGAGKTTLIRTILGYVRPTDGSATVCEFDVVRDPVAVRSNVAYLPGDARVPRHMNGHGVLKFFAEIHPGGDRELSIEIADELELDLSRRVNFMSTGMRQKLALSVVMSVHCPVMILDEPTANLDPSVRAAVLDRVIAARDLGRTVVLSSHVMSEIEDTCDRVAFLRRGELVRELTMDELNQRHRITATMTPANPPIIPPSMTDRAEWFRLPDYQNRTNRVRIDCSGDLAAVLPIVVDAGLTDVRIEPIGLRTIYDEVHRGKPAVPPTSLSPPTDESVVAAQTVGTN